LEIRVYKSKVDISPCIPRLVAHWSRAEPG